MARFYPTGGTGGANVSVVTALAEDVAKGKVIVGQDGKPITGTLELTGTAADSQVLAGQTYYNTDLKAKRTGAMTNRGAWNSSGLAAGAAVTIPAGYHNGGGKVTAKDLVSQTSGDATAAQIWTGKKAWVNGKQITGTLATQGGSTTTPGTAAKTVVTPNKIITGSIIVAGDGNLVAENIKKNVTIFGVKGTCEGWFPTATDLYLRGQNIWFDTSYNGSFKFEAGELYVNPSYSGGGTLHFKSAFDFSPYKKLNFQFKYESANFGSGAVIELQKTSSGSAIVSVNPAQHNNEQTVSIDVSSLYQSDDWYIDFGIRQAGIHVYHIWVS